MIELGPCEITGVFGPMASGKTFLINHWLKDDNRYVRFDVTGESMDNATVEQVWASPKKLWERLQANPYYYQVAYQPGPEIETDFDIVLKIMWRNNKGFRTLVCDEFHEVCSVHQTPKNVRTMLRFARHNHLAMIGASQRIADVHKLFTAGCRQVILFWTQEACDLDAIAQRWGKSTAVMVRNLRPLIYNDKTKITLQIPQAVVCSKVALPRVFDFKTDGFLSEPRQSSSSEEATEEIQGEDSGDIPDVEPTGESSGDGEGESIPNA